jgi:ATP synthase protein I
LRLIRVALFEGGNPICTVLRWQLYATVVAALIAASWQGLHGAYSALLGGFVNMTAGAFFAWLAARGDDKTTAGERLYALFRAEAGKVILIGAQLWLVLATYKHLVPATFFAVFFLTVMLFTTAFVAQQQ